MAPSSGGNATDQSKGTISIVGIDCSTTYSDVAFSACGIPEVAVMKDRPGWRDEELAAAAEHTSESEAMMRQNANAQDRGSDLQSDANSQAGDLSTLDAAELDIRGCGGDCEKLDHRYYRRPDAKEFFAPGRVFALLWHEGAGDKKGGRFSQEEPFNVQTNGKKKEKYNGEVFSHIRRMVVVNTRDGHCLCMPVNVYNYQGVAKKGLSHEHRQAHSAIYMDDTKPAIHPTETGMMFKPVNFEQKWSTTPFRPASLIVFRSVKISQIATKNPVFWWHASNATRFEQSYGTTAVAARPFDEGVDLGTDIRNPVDKVPVSHLRTVPSSSKMASQSWMNFSCIPNEYFTSNQANQAYTYQNTDQALISSVDLCQSQPSLTIQHLLSASCNAADQAIQYLQHTTHLPGCVYFPESSNSEAELAFQHMWNGGSEPAGFDFDPDFDLSLRNQQSLTLPSFCCGFCCALCPKSFPQRWKLNRHLRRHEKPFKCEVSSCRAAFALRKDLRRHVKQVHHGFASDEDILKCLFPICSFSSTRRDSLKRHLQGVHGVEIRFGASTSPSASSEP